MPAGAWPRKSLQPIRQCRAIAPHQSIWTITQDASQRRVVSLHAALRARVDGNDRLLNPPQLRRVGQIGFAQYNSVGQRQLPRRLGLVRQLCFAVAHVHQDDCAAIRIAFGKKPVMLEHE
ncbi:hypothetical protein D3C72_1575580 [compost metagenome]